ncbi:MAG: SNF2-related protein, partial [Syntrophorhabdales bacterium]
MALSRSEQILLDALQTLPPNSVYADATKREILRGFKLFVDHRTTCIGWEGDGTLVLDMGPVPLDDPAFRPASVSILREGGRFRFRCTHPEHDGVEKCEHIICALITVIHILRPNLFRMAKEDPGYQTLLQTGLFKRARPEPPKGGKVVSLSSFQAQRREAVGRFGVKEAAQFQVFVERTERGLRAFVERDGENIEDRSDRDMPWELASLVESAYQQDMSMPLLLFLGRGGNRYPIFYREGSVSSRVEWLGELPCATWTELDASDGEIVVRKACSLGRKRETPGIPLGDFVVNGERTQMARMARTNGWHYWDMLRSACRDNSAIAVRMREIRDTEFCVPAEVFRELQFFVRKSRLKEALRSMTCMVAGTEATVRTASVGRYRLVITTDKRSGYLITPECCSGTYLFHPSQKIISLIRSVELARVPFRMRTKKRKPLFYAALFDALARDGGEQVDAVVRESINEETFGRHHFASEAASLIKRSIDAFRAEDQQFHFADQEWQVIAVDKEKEKLLFLLPYRVFGPAIYSRMARRGTSMAVAQGDLFERLHLLHSLAGEADIELSFDGRPVLPVTWDLELDASGGTIDWFEIRPEISCNGKPIPRELWEQALSRKGVIAHGGSIQILDGKSLHALSLVARLWGPATKKTRAGQREITTVPRLRIIDLFALRKQGIAVRLTAEDEAIMARLARFQGIEDRPLPDRFGTDLRQYQKEGYYWLAFLYEHRFGACLADDMGLGKTVQAICLLAAIKEGKIVPPASASQGPARRQSLIVVPPSLIFNWEREIGRFYPELKLYSYRGRD